MDHGGWCAMRMPGMQRRQGSEVRGPFYAFYWGSAVRYRLYTKVVHSCSVYCTVGPADPCGADRAVACEACDEERARKELPKDLGGLRGLDGPACSRGGLRDLLAHLRSSRVAVEDCDRGGPWVTGGGDRSVRAFRTASSKFLICSPQLFGLGLPLVSLQWLCIQR